jgi:hypothetical protein
MVGTITRNPRTTAICLVLALGGGEAWAGAPPLDTFGGPLGFGVDALPPA